MKIIALMAAIAISSVAMAQVDTSGMTTEDIAKLQLEAEKLKKERVSQADRMSVDKAKEYIELGEMVGKAMGSAAKELNMAVNDFAQTPVGRTAMILIVWKVIGREAMKFAIGLGFIVAFVPIWIWFFRKMCIVKSVEYSEGGWIRRAKAVVHYKDGEIDGTRAVMLIVLVLIVGASQIIMWVT
jgi:hypothetical protein